MIATRVQNGDASPSSTRLDGDATRCGEWRRSSSAVFSLFSFLSSPSLFSMRPDGAAAVTPAGSALTLPSPSLLRLPTPLRLPSSLSFFLFLFFLSSIYMCCGCVCVREREKGEMAANLGEIRVRVLF
ncbi:uncharacterized protein DS421_2g34260 [Arachis hypogaea]|nr:uncharacterized protein DS421_2g34260 [Arachis hypogaea]